MRIQLLYPLMLVVIILGVVGLFSFRYSPLQESPNNIIFVGLEGTSERVSVDEMVNGCGVEDRSIYDIWLGQTKKYTFVKVNDLLNCLSDIPADDLQYTINVVFTNIQGKTISIPLTNIIEYEDSFLLAIMYKNEELKEDFSNNETSGGPSRLLIDYSIDYSSDFLSENYGPEYWLWCIYKISLVKGPVA